jgi:hypothetical protein
MNGVISPCLVFFFFSVQVVFMIRIFGSENSLTFCHGVES